MKHIQVLLVKPVKNLGNEGEAVTVKPGYARNYLLPQGMAVPVTRSTKRQLEVLAVRRAERLSKELDTAKALAEKMSAMVITIAVKTGDDGKPHGAITNMEIHKALTALEVVVDRHLIKIGEPIKELGEHIVTVKIHPEVVVEVKINVVSENPLPEKKSVEEPRRKARKTVKSEEAKAEEVSEEPKAE
jgi:large subunit ribosomal protein L9